MVQYLGCYNTLDQFQHRQYLFTKAMSEKPILFSKVQKKASTNRPAKHEASKNRGKELRVAKDRTEAKTQTIAYSFSLLGERGSIDLPANSSKREIMKAKAEAQFINRNEQIRKRERGDKLKIQKPSIACEKGNSMRTVEIGCKQSSILPQFKSTELEIAGKNIPPSVQEDKGQERSHKPSKALLKADKRITPQSQFASEPSKPKDLGESEEKKFEVRNSPLFRLDNIGKTPNFDTKMIEKGSHEADTSLEKTQVEQKVKQALKRQRKSKKSRSQLKNGKDLSEGKSVDGRNGFKKRVKRD